MKNPYIQLGLFSIVILFLTVLAIFCVPIVLPAVSWWAFAFFVLLTAVVHALISPTLKSNNTQFVTLFMTTQGLRMFLSLGFLLLYFVFVIKKEVSFVIYFLLLYLSFTGFEIYLLLSNLRADLKKESIQE